MNDLVLKNKNDEHKKVYSISYKKDEIFKEKFYVILILNSKNWHPPPLQ